MKPALNSSVLQCEALLEVVLVIGVIRRKLFEAAKETVWVCINSCFFIFGTVRRSLLFSFMGISTAAGSRSPTLLALLPKFTEAAVTAVNFFGGRDPPCLTFAAEVDLSS